MATKQHEIIQMQSNTKSQTMGFELVCIALMFQNQLKHRPTPKLLTYCFRQVLSNLAINQKP